MLGVTALGLVSCERKEKMVKKAEILMEKISVLMTNAETSPQSVLEATRIEFVLNNFTLCVTSVNEQVPIILWAVDTS